MTIIVAIIIVIIIITTLKRSQQSIYIYSLYVQYNVIILLGHNITDNDVNTQQNEACVKMNIVFQLLEHVVYSNNNLKIILVKDCLIEIIPSSSLIHVLIIFFICN